MKIDLETFERITNNFEEVKEYTYGDEYYEIHFEKENDKVFLVCENKPPKQQEQIADAKIEELIKLKEYIDKEIKDIWSQRHK